MEIIHTETPATEAGKELSKLLAIYKDLPVLLLVSGGSSFSVLEYCDSAFLDSRITLGVLDERYSKDQKINNFLQLVETSFFKTAEEKEVIIINSSVQEDETIEELSERLDQILKEWVIAYPEGKILATMGIGEDGHIAGIFPHTNTNFSDEKFVTSYSAPESITQYTERVTTTFNFLQNHVDEAIVYAVGDAKKNILNKLETGTVELSDMPAAIIKTMKSVKIFTN